MKNRFRLIQRGLRGGTIYCVDCQTGRRESLCTKDSDEAAQLVLARNLAARQPALNLQMAKAFLSASDDALAKRTWHSLFPTFSKLKEGHRSTHFKRTWRKGGVNGVTLHSYRHAWAQRTFAWLVAPQSKLVSSAVGISRG